MFDDVADTALWVAAYRAKESARPDALFHDPFAEQLAGARGKKLARTVVGTKSFEWSIVVRTRVIDDLLEEAIAGGIDTVLNLGAGMDTRPFRLRLPPELRWIEVDGARIMALKEPALPAAGARCKLERRTVDLANPAERDALLTRLEGKALVLTEGVVGYLTNDDVAALARGLRAQPAVQRWVVDYSSPMLRRSMRRRLRVRHQFRHTPFRFKPGDWERFFLDTGWKLDSMRYLVEAGEHLGRPIQLPTYVRIVLGLLRRQSEMRRMMGYGVLVPT